MKKSEERVRLEKELYDAHMESIALSEQTARNIFGKSFEEIEEDEQALRQLVVKVRFGPWQKYVGRQKELLDLEKKEGFPAFSEYVKHIDFVGVHIPRQARRICYHPFSGLDFLWARIFTRLVNEDFGFSADDLSWWSPQEYKVIQMLLPKTLRKLGFIPKKHRIECLGTNSLIPQHLTKTLNRKSCTLLVKRGHDNLSFIGSRFLERQIPLRFGAIVFEGGFYSHSLEETENVLLKEGYKLLMRYGRETDDLEYTIPYALGPGRNCALFVPK